MLFKLARQLMFIFLVICLCAMTSISIMFFQEGVHGAIYVGMASMFALLMLLILVK